MTRKSSGPIISFTRFTYYYHLALLSAGANKPLLRGVKDVIEGVDDIGTAIDAINAFKTWSR